MNVFKKIYSKIYISFIIIYSFNKYNDKKKNIIEKDSKINLEKVESLQPRLNLLSAI